MEGIWRQAKDDFEEASARVAKSLHANLQEIEEATWAQNQALKALKKAEEDICKTIEEKISQLTADEMRAIRDRVDRELRELWRDTEVSRFIQKGGDEIQLRLYGDFLLVNLLVREGRYPEALKVVEQVRDRDGLKTRPGALDQAEMLTFYTPNTLRRKIVLAEYIAKAKLRSSAPLALAIDFRDHRDELAPIWAQVKLDPSLAQEDPTGLILEPIGQLDWDGCNRARAKDSAGFLAFSPLEPR